ncbi:hypothetical protein LINPERPRIM_LOCUS27721 [Linum perenne]
MGNRHGRSAAVQPLNHQGGHHGEEAAIRELLSPAPTSIDSNTPSGVRIRVGMTIGQLNELMGQIPSSKLRGRPSGNECSSSELGRLILRECLKGRFRARVIGVLPAQCRSLSSYGHED